MKGRGHASFFFVYCPYTRKGEGMTLLTPPAKATILFHDLCQRYPQYLDESMQCPYAGWFASLQWALEEAETLGYSFRIKDFSIQFNRLVPHFSEGKETDKKAFNEMLSETFHFCPYCGQSCNSERML